LPPYLAGREPEQRVLNEQHDLVAVGAEADTPVWLVGPRGNGKTALLRWFRRKIEAGGDADVVWLTPTKVPDVGSLARRLAPEAIPGEGKAATNLGGLRPNGTLAGSGTTTWNRF